MQGLETKLEPGSPFGAGSKRESEDRPPPFHFNIPVIATVIISKEKFLSEKVTAAQVVKRLECLLAIWREQGKGVALLVEQKLRFLFLEEILGLKHEAQEMRQSHHSSKSKQLHAISRINPELQIGCDPHLHKH